MYIFKPHIFYIMCGTNCCSQPDCTATCGWLADFSHAAFAAIPEFVEKNAISRGPVTIVFTGGNPIDLDIFAVYELLNQLRCRLGGRVHFIFETCNEGINEAWMELLLEFNVTLENVEQVRRETFPHYLKQNYDCEALEYATSSIFVNRQPDWSLSFSIRRLNVERRKIRDDMLYGELIPMGLTSCSYQDHWAIPDEGEVKDAYYRMLEKYKAEEKPGRRLFLLEDVCRSYYGRRSSCCTFSDCLGERCAITGDGGVYPCPRGAYRMTEPLVRLSSGGSVSSDLASKDSISWDSVEDSPVWQTLCQKKEEMKAGCRQCENFGMCRGGCVLNGTEMVAPRDWYCDCYQKLFNHVQQVMHFGCPGMKAEYDAFAGRGRCLYDQTMGERGYFSKAFALQHGEKSPTDLDPFRKEPLRRGLSTEWDFGTPWLSGKKYGTLFLHLNENSDLEKTAALSDEAGLEGFQELVLFDTELAKIDGAADFLKALLENNGRWMRLILSRGGESLMTAPEIVRYFDEVRPDDPCPHSKEDGVPGSRFIPRLSCGLGFHLSVDPDGQASPCEKTSWLAVGNAREESLDTIMNRKIMTAFRSCDVDSNAKCRRCHQRYLCGGPCKSYVWSASDLDSPDFLCPKK